jgi:subtilisin family serine protease
MSRDNSRAGTEIAKPIAAFVAALCLLVGSAMTADAQNRANFVPGITALPAATPPSISSVAPPPIAVPPPVTIRAPIAAPASVSTTTLTTTNTSVERIVGTQPDPSAVVPNTRILQQQSRSGGLDDNFLTEDWGRGRNRYGARVAVVRKHVDTPTPPPPVGGNTNIAATGIASTASRDVLILVDGTSTTDAQVEALAQRHRLIRIESLNIPMLAGTLFRWRIPDNRPMDRVLNDLSNDSAVRFSQRNMVYRAQDAGAKAPAEGDAGQYALAKLHLPEAHLLARGTDVAIAVIDSGIDVTHPELAGAIIGTYDALNSKEGAHPHGTGVAGTIVAHSRLVGGAPAAHLLAIRAFAANPSSGAESTSFVVLKALNYAVQQNAQIINMSFAGPADPLVQQALGVAFARGIVLVAAAGNAGPNSPPLYPAADSHVIAVTATDSGDHLFGQANRGPQVAIAAPGVDILMPAPEDKYQVNSGTSFAAAYVSGVAALLIDRNPGVTPDGIRAALTATAHDLGPKGRDDQFGAGLADALAAVQEVSRSMSAGAAKTEAVPAAAPGR